jgi:hypothetical protein
MRHGLLVSALLLALATQPAGASAQATGQPRHPDPAAVVLSQSDLDGWTQTSALRQQTWPLQDDPQTPGGYGSTYGFATDFIQTLPDGSQLTLHTDVGEAAQADIDQHFADLQHDALDQQPIALPDLGVPTVAWWEATGETTRQAGAAAELGGVIVELRLSGVPATQTSVLESQVANWLSSMTRRAQAAPDRPPFDWNQVVPGQPAPWTRLLEQADVSSNWLPATGLELISQEAVPGSAGLQLSADLTFDRGTPYRRTLTDTVTVFPSAEAASAQGMTAQGTAIDVPPLGDEVTAFRLVVSDPPRTGDVAYTINVRSGPLVATIHDQGAATSLDSPAEPLALARLAAGKLTTTPAPGP